MMSHRYTTSSVAIFALFDLLRSREVFPHEISLKTGIDETKIGKPDIRITMNQFQLLWELAIEHSGNKALGLQLRTVFGTNIMHFVSILARNSVTLHEAVSHWCRFAPLICESVRVTMRREGDMYMVTFANLYSEFQCVSLVEHDFTSMLYFARKFTGKKVDPVEVHFQHAEPAYRDLYEAYFKCPVRFNQAENAFFFCEKTMNTMSVTPNLHLQSVLKKHAETQIRHYSGKEDLIREVEEFIHIHLPRGEMDISSVCNSLNMSRSTLYRKLKDQGLTFSKLLRKIRKRLAITYLKQEMNADQIAYLLGFTEPSTFRHAFKRWFGKSPGEIRKRLKPAPKF